MIFQSRSWLASFYIENIPYTCIENSSSESVCAGCFKRFLTKNAPTHGGIRTLNSELPIANDKRVATVLV